MAATPPLTAGPQARLGAMAPPARRPTLRIAAAAAAAATAATMVAVLVPGAATPAAADVRFTRHGGYLIASFQDPDASAAALKVAFERRNLNIAVELLPVSPSLVGTVLYSDSPALTAAKQGPCVTGGGACPVALRIPTNFTGSAHIAVGRQARPREQFASAAVSAFAPGESLHCTGLLGGTVAQAQVKLAAMGIHAKWRAWTNGPDGLIGSWTSTPPPGSYYVQSAIPANFTTVLMDAEAERYSAKTQSGINNFTAFNRQLNAGC